MDNSIIPLLLKGAIVIIPVEMHLISQLHDYMLRKYKVVSWESIIAGPGIYSIFQFLCEIKKRTVSVAIEDKLKTGDPSAVISEAAIEESDPVCIEALRIFVRNLARECCNLILKMKSTGGLLLAGGIPPKIISLIAAIRFFMKTSLTATVCRTS